MHNEQEHQITMNSELCAALAFAVRALSASAAFWMLTEHLPELITAIRWW